MGLLEQFPPVSFKTCVLIVLASIGLHLLRNKYRPHLRRIPGPAIAGYTDLWRFINCLTSTPHQTHIDLHRKYASKFIRIGPRTISISDTTLIPKIYGLNSGFTKTAFYSLSMPPYKGQFTPSLFTTRDEEYHAKHRRPIASAYSMSTLVEVEPLIDSTTSLFMRRLDEFAAEGQMFDLGLWLQMFAFDVIGEVVFSKKLGFLETRSDVDGIIGNIRKKVRLGGTIGQIPAVGAVLIKNPIYLALADTHPVVKFTVDRMLERQGKPPPAGDSDHESPLKKQPPKRDFLARCYEAQAKDPDLVTDRIIRMYNVDNILAGSDTTAISLRAVLYYLLKTPDALHRCLAEIDALEQSSEFITWKESNSMPYLQVSIKEALRMHPAVGLPLEREVPKDGMQLDGQYFPEGTIVGVNPWVAARSKEIYGADADVFRPSRWFEADSEHLRAMERANLTFGHGARSCIGKNISLLEIAKLVPQLLKHYDFKFPTEGYEWKVLGGWFVGQDDFEVVIKRRGQGVLEAKTS